MKKIRAKFKCQRVVPADEKNGYPTHASLYAIHENEDGSECEENKSFSELTPAGNVEIMISPKTPAHKYFREGREYYLDFTRIPLEKK